MTIEKLEDIKGYFKVSQDGGIFITATFYNPLTGKELTTCVRDYDYADGRRDNDDLYYLPIDENARKQWKHKRGEILVNDTIEIYKGRKYPAGTTGVVIDIKPFYDRYNRFICNYLYLDNGMKVNADNCKLMEVKDNE